MDCQRCVEAVSVGALMIVVVKQATGQVDERTTIRAAGFMGFGDRGTAVALNFSVLPIGLGHQDL